MHDYLSWPADSLDPSRLAAQAQIIRVVAMVAAKVGDEARRGATGHASLRSSRVEFAEKERAAADT